jgi:nucleotide-binding universal stress UspA family protein
MAESGAETPANPQPAPGTTLLPMPDAAGMDGAAMARPMPEERDPDPPAHDDEDAEAVSRPRVREREKAAAPYIVLVGLDLSEPGGRAWRFAFDLAELRGEETEIHAVVIGARGMAPEVKDVATPRVSTSALSARPTLKVLQHRSAGGKARLMAMHYREGSPDRAIVRLAREIDADLIVVASQPTTRLQRLFGGSIADRIARNAPCPVVVVRPKRNEEDPGLFEYDPQEER